MQDLNEHKKAIQDITELFDKHLIKTLDESIEMANHQYGLLVSYFDTTQVEEEKRWSVRYTISNLVPLLQKMLVSPKVNETKVGQVYSIYRRAYAFCGRRSLVHFCDFMEWERPTDNKVYQKRKEILDIVLFYLNKLALDDKLKKVAISLPPSFAKSYSGNYYTAWRFGMNRNATILRMSCGDNLLNGFSRAIKDLIQSDQYSEVFPEFANYRNRPFEKEKESDWKIKNSDYPTSHFIRTRDGQVVGTRANSDIILDDMTKGLEEAYNDDLHKKIWQQWLTEWSNRKDGLDTKYLFLGTMWNPYDLLNLIAQEEERYSPLLPSKKHKYVGETEDGSFACIRIPLLDENDKSTCEQVTSTVEALKLRDNTDPFLFAAVYQQNPIAPSGLEFTYDELRTYDELPKELNNYCFAALDPTRKGIDNISMPILKSNGDSTDFYMIDVLYKKIPMTEAYDLIVEKIIQHNILKLHIENNTDTSLKAILEMKLKEKGVNYCDISEVYNVQKKEIRIKDMRGLMKKKMLFKKKGMVSANSDYGRFMASYTSYSFDYANKNDDAPDSLALFAKKFLLETRTSNSFEIFDRRKLGL